MPKSSGDLSAGTSDLSHSKKLHQAQANYAWNSMWVSAHLIWSGCKVNYSPLSTLPCFWPYFRWWLPFGYWNCWSRAKCIRIPQLFIYHTISCFDSWVNCAQLSVNVYLSMCNPCAETDSHLNHKQQLNQSLHKVEKFSIRFLSLLCSMRDRVRLQIWDKRLDISGFVRPVLMWFKISQYGAKYSDIR